MKILPVLLYICALLALRCGQENLNSGTGSEVEGKFAIKGVAVDDEGMAVAGAAVRMRPKGFLALYANKFAAFDTITDSRGRFYFDSTVTDSYTIEINKDGKFGALQQMTIEKGDTFPIILPAVTIKPTGTITGRINLPITDDTSRPLIALYSVDYLAKTMITQDFRFDGVPAGTYRLRIVPSLSSKLMMELHDVEVVSDSIVDVGTLNLVIQQFFKGCGSWTCDSMAVRSLLDANGLASVRVIDVINTDSLTGRVITLDLNGRGVKKITKDIGSLSTLKLLDMCNNHIGSLPGHIGYLRSLESCYLDSNDLNELPPEFGYLESLRELTIRGNNLYCLSDKLVSMPLEKLDIRNNRLESLPDLWGMFRCIKYLYLDSNMLQSIPDVMTQLRPQELSVSHNRLCDTTEAYARWFSLYDKDWRLSQDCK